MIRNTIPTASASRSPEKRFIHVAGRAAGRCADDVAEQRVERVARRVRDAGRSRPLGDQLAAVPRRHAALHGEHVEDEREQRDDARACERDPVGRPGGAGRSRQPRGPAAGVTASRRAGPTRRPPPDCGRVTVTALPRTLLLARHSPLIGSQTPQLRVKPGRPCAAARRCAAPSSAGTPGTPSSSSAARREHPLGRAEVAQQRPAPHRPDALELVEHRLARARVAALPVEGDREPVRLVADAAAAAAARASASGSSTGSGAAGQEDLLDPLRERRSPRRAAGRRPASPRAPRRAGPCRRRSRPGSAWPRSDSS